MSIGDKLERASSKSHTNWPLLKNRGNYDTTIIFQIILLLLLVSLNLHENAKL